MSACVVHFRPRVSDRAGEYGTKTVYSKPPRSPAHDVLEAFHVPLVSGPIPAQRWRIGRETFQRVLGNRELYVLYGVDHFLVCAFEKGCDPSFEY